METIYIIILFFIAFISIFFIVTYNSLVRLKNDVSKAFSGIDVQLKRRNDLIPNLINTVKGYASHEREVLENVTKARASLLDASNKGDVKSIAQNENMLSGALKSLFAVSENYPDLKANENFLKLQEELKETEDQISASRRIFNENVTYYNNKREVFPSNIIAGMFGFGKKDLFEATEEEKKEIKVEF